MFGVPERRAEGNTVHIYVPMAKPERLGLRLKMNSKLDVFPDVSVQSTFATLQKEVLTELTKTEVLFKNKPSYDSLERITPQWGVIYDTDNKPQWNKYTESEFFFDVKMGAYTNAIVDLELIGILITRSTISPKFAVKFVEPDTKTEVIDFDWQATPAVPANQSKEIEEINDLDAPLTADTLTLRSPALIAKEKESAKEQVRVLFRTADDARQKALDAMANFFSKYEVSDDESQFSDWLTDDESTNSTS